MSSIITRRASMLTPRRYSEMVGVARTLLLALLLLASTRLSRARARTRLEDTRHVTTALF